MHKTCIRNWRIFKGDQDKIFVIKNLINLKLQDEPSIGKHLTEIQYLVNQLNIMKITLDDEIHALLLLSLLSNSWKTLVVSLTNSVPNGILFLSLVNDSLYNEETIKKDMNINT